MKIAELLEGSVIDAAEKFKVASHQAFKQRVEKAQLDASTGMARQRELEAQVADKLVELNNGINKSLSRYRLQLRPLSKNYQDDVNLLDVLIFSLGEVDMGNDNVKSAKEQAIEFMRVHIDELLAVAEKQVDNLHKLKEEFEAKDWPTGARGFHRYTKFSSALTEAERRVVTLQSFKGSKKMMGAR